MSAPVSRREQIAAGLAEVRRRIAAACADAGRDESGVHLVVVTKTFPATDVRVLADLGVTDVGENRHQEAAGKHAECADLPLTWHFVGALQTNKAAAVAEYADVVHSVDRSRLVRALARATERTGRPLRCLLQVNLDPAGDDTGVIGRRSGTDPGDVPALADEVAGHRSLEVAGVMGVAPVRGDPQEAFSRLAEIAAEVRGRHPGATMVSAGMSGDLEAAVRCGATHVRVGSAVLGERPPNR
ncbi:MAG: YggS family pyridoxal phosphate-dependent enzyme [Actinomycetota bacterium]|nr:YggS family pyridoxal phosphate-dependent enzyme [Actinomycetota bacterium]